MKNVDFGWAIILLLFCIYAVLVVIACKTCDIYTLLGGS